MEKRHWKADIVFSFDCSILLRACWGDLKDGIHLISFAGRLRGLQRHDLTAIDQLRRRRVHRSCCPFGRKSRQTRRSRTQPLLRIRKEQNPKKAQTKTELASGVPKVLRKQCWSGPVGIWTPDLLSASQAFIPTELPAHVVPFGKERSLRNLELSVV